MITEEKNLGISSSRAVRQFRQRLLRWYDHHRRELPWRADRDAYRVWLSEVMLQQTRVAAVVEYYRRFLQRFPNVEVLAAARESSVLAAWSGLGYYRRARMLYRAAKQVVNEHEGKFPETAEGLLALPGIGRYTAAAVASIAFNEPEAVVDGNVQRVLQRVLGRPLADKEQWRAAERLLSRDRPGDFNQAMMELGATVCLPRGPVCSECPLLAICATRGENEKPIKNKRENKQRVHYALDAVNDSVFLVKRPKMASLMPGMWELPEIAPHNGKPSFILKHSITVTDYTVRVTCRPAPKGTVGRWVERDKISRLPLTGLTRKILRTASII